LSCNKDKAQIYRMAEGGGCEQNLDVEGSVSYDKWEPVTYARNGISVHLIT